VGKVAVERQASEHVAGKIVAAAVEAHQTAATELHKRHAEVLARQPGGIPAAAWKGAANATTEPLGQGTIEGVLAEGSRTTTVLPAGAIGNVQEIKVVSEQWFSPELDVLVATTHSDPRSGETTYRLSNIVKGEPRGGLFDVPPDYTVREASYMRQPLPR
jgi:hypothetical protein